jgi:hypothetical protein
VSLISVQLESQYTPLGSLDALWEIAKPPMVLPESFVPAGLKCYGSVCSI